MKKKLLLTMGCSVTQGFGCYDISTFKYVPDKPWDEYEDLKHIIKIHENRFLQYSWGSVLQKKLKYDRFVNMGKGGSSTSGQVKLFFENIDFLKSLKDYDVLLIWLLTSPSRFSFYSSGTNIDIIPNSLMNRNFLKSEIDKAYINFVDDIDTDTLLEQKFYKDIIQETAKGLGFKFLYHSSLSGSNEEFIIKFKKMFNDSNNLANLSKKTLIPCSRKNPELYSLLKCYHPNEEGYKIIGKNFFDLIKIYNSDLINEYTPTVYEQEKIHEYKKYNLI